MCRWYDQFVVLDWLLENIYSSVVKLLKVPFQITPVTKQNNDNSTSNESKLFPNWQSRLGFFSASLWSLKTSNIFVNENNDKKFIWIEKLVHQP